MVLSTAAEDYLKTIYKLRETGVRAVGNEARGNEARGNEAREGAPVTTQALADGLQVAAPSATAMVKKLASLKLVAHEPYRGVTLTPAGEKIALEVIRHHRLVETFLAEVLGMDWDQVHDEAEKWEHILSEEVEAKIDAALNSPTHDPHGAPIPTLDGRIASDGWQPLLRAGAGDRVTVRRVSDRNPAVLRHLREVGLIPGARLEVLRAAPESGVLELQVEAQARIVGTEPARAVWVSHDGDTPSSNLQNDAAENRK
ncbi:MAG: DtxR family transcriptional regulator, Mn-dependent transcriptional regulator [Abditibacteriota bacterium]|nr:DtxR family transcriptional regulator, Mn-dependent transcriptional regulator [Abditibacteriota bacterium]